MTATTPIEATIGLVTPWTRSGVVTALYVEREVAAMTLEDDRVDQCGRTPDASAAQHQPHDRAHVICSNVLKHQSEETDHDARLSEQFSRRDDFVAQIGASGDQGTRMQRCNKAQSKTDSHPNREMLLSEP